MVYTESFITIVSIALRDAVLPEKRTSLQVYESTRKELIRVRGQLESENGKRRSFDDIIMELISSWREKQKK